MPEKTPKKAGAADGLKHKPTARDLELMYFALQCARDPAIDYNKFANVAGFSSAASARSSWCALKRKFFEHGDAAGTPVDSAKKGKATGSGQDDQAEARPRGRPEAAPEAKAESSAKPKVESSPEAAQEGDSLEVCPGSEESN
ncbi:unnamed protein product [Parascedosporium putredinis]|uniref:Uncharacterized protein n=1 Tax=Parascedosporium putredinis TaxID=1442378 RepID=A0A9P1GZW6_9PEZI|nr:unnamed protein product [Parascedosporium putredinis]CAI7991542.1 unnamed protein product [Parascedosporium putredinis]